MRLKLSFVLFAYHTDDSTNFSMLQSGMNIIFAIQKLNQMSNSFLCIYERGEVAYLDSTGRTQRENKKLLNHKKIEQI